MSNEVVISADACASCCIQSEVGYFEARRVGYRDFNVEAVDWKTCAKKFVQAVIDRTKSYEDYEHDGVQIRFFWFKDPVNYKGEFTGNYEFAELREEVKNHPLTKHIGTYINANTGNRMDGYMMVIDCEKGECEDD